MKINLISIITLVVAALTLSSCTQTGGPEINIEGAKFMRSPIKQHAGAIFMVIMNDGDRDDSLISFSVPELPSVRAELHDMIGRKMIEVENIEVPAGEMVILKRGGLHLMLFDLPEKIYGDSLTVRLNFKSSGIVEVKAEVWS